MTRPLTAKQLLDAAKHATGFAWHVPGNEHVIVAVQPQWLAGEHWTVQRIGDDNPATVWTGERWEVSNLPVDQIYRFDLTQALQHAARCLADLSMPASAWRAQHVAPADFEDEFLAEFAAEVA